ncbi:hypothetical protein, partial [Streptomyces sp. CS014]|uniref:hypothetical protein n=1 Tax=Streptomyces sp. CS014 TaxID=2162707 RepID=UPI001EF6FAA1
MFVRRGLEQPSADGDFGGQVERVPGRLREVVRELFGRARNSDQLRDRALRAEHNLVGSVFVLGV